MKRTSLGGNSLKSALGTVSAEKMGNGTFTRSLPPPTTTYSLTPYSILQVLLIDKRIRVFYDVVEPRVEILAIIPKSKAAEWLEEIGEKK